MATQKFAEVQAAYEVLSDPQERAWYDSHRDAILKGNDGFDDDTQPTTFHNVRLTTTEEIHNLISRFNSTIAFNDEPTGFFGIARETFEHLALEEEAAADFDGSDSPNYPSFGSSGDDYESTVRPFYNAWTGFITRKSFSWKDKYRLSDAPDRRIRRLMEKENKKIRDEAARDFNDAIRFLVTFVRKRDPRYLPNTQTDSERQKSMRDAAANQAAKARAANQERIAAYEPPSWDQSREESPEEDAFPETEVESEAEVFECIVCNKSFKSEKQLQVHEASKKHIKATQKLRWRMQKEGAKLHLDPDRAANIAEPAHDLTPRHEYEVATSYESHEILGDDGDNHTTKEKMASQGVSDEPAMAVPDDASEDDDYAPRNAVERRFALDQNDPHGNPSDDPNVDYDLLAATEKASLRDTSPKKNVGKAKAKREKRAAQAAHQIDIVSSLTRLKIPHFPVFARHLLARFYQQFSITYWARA